MERCLIGRESARPGGRGVRVHVRGRRRRTHAGAVDALSVRRLAWARTARQMGVSTVGGLGSTDGITSECGEFVSQPVFAFNPRVLTKTTLRSIPDSLPRLLLT